MREFPSAARTLKPHGHMCKYKLCALGRVALGKKVEVELYTFPYHTGELSYPQVYLAYMGYPPLLTLLIQSFYKLLHHRKLMHDGLS